MRASLRRTTFGLLAIGLVAAAVTTLVAIDDALFKEWNGRQHFIDDLNRLAATPGRTVTLADLTGHPVDRTCLISEYVSALPAATERGLPVDTFPDVVVRELHVGLLMAGPETTSYGELPNLILDWRDIFPASCVVGRQLALQFETIDPLTGGRIIDLTAPDLLPTVVDL